MQNKLHDAADLLKMLELVVQQHVDSAPQNGHFPWGGMRLTLKQARELITEAALQPRAAEQRQMGQSQAAQSQADRPAAPQQPRANQSRPNQEMAEHLRRDPIKEDLRGQEARAPETRPPESRGRGPVPPAPRQKESASNSAEAPFRGTFNRIQLTEETADPREDQTTASNV